MILFYFIFVIKIMQKRIEEEVIYMINYKKLIKKIFLKKHFGIYKKRRRFEVG